MLRVHAARNGWYFRSVLLQRQPEEDIPRPLRRTPASFRIEMKFSTLLLCLLALSAFSVVLAGRLGEGEGDLDACLQGLSEDSQTEATLEIELDALKAEYDSIRHEVDVWQWYRDDNRTDAMVCLKNLTLCNDANEFKTVSVNGDKREVHYRDVEQLKFKHPIEKHEDALKARIAALDRHFAKGGVKLSPKRHTREVLQCTLEQCIDFRASSIAYINSLEMAIEKYHQKISDVKNGVITWSRFSRQYQDLLNVCLATLDKCTSGARLLKISYTNGSPRTFSANVNAAWAGLGDSTFSFAAYDAELSALSTGDDVAVDDAFSGTNLDGLTLTAFPAAPLADGESILLGNLEADATYHTHFSYIATQVNSAYQLPLPGTSLVLFDEEGNFIHDASREPNKRRSTRGKRYNWPDLDCGAEGHPIPFGEPHIRTFLATDLFSEGAIDSNNGGYGAFTVEEIRFVAPYPSSIPASAFLPEGAV